MRGSLLFVQRTPVAARGSEFRKDKAMPVSLFRCQDKLADLFMSAKFIMLLSTSLITYKQHKTDSPSPEYAYPCPQRDYRWHFTTCA
jgi:hypothetical protein